MSGQYNTYLSDTNRERLKGIHDKKTSSPEVVARIIAKSINKKIVNYDRILNGEVNEVYNVELEDGSEVIIRIGHDKDQGFEAETWAIKQAKKADVPVANVLAIGVESEAEKTLHYSIQEKLRGKRFDTLLWAEQISPERAQAITKQAGEILARIHSITATSGYGNTNLQGQGKFANAEAWVKAQLGKRDYFKMLFAANNLGPDILDAVLAKIEEASTLLTSHPHLLHSDYGPKHIFVGDDDVITGIIDFEDVESGDSAMDFASWDYWFRDKLPTEWLTAGYQRVASLGNRFSERLTVAQLHELLDLLDYYTNRAPAPEEATRASEVIKQLVA